ncbi:MAG TPA: BTAD domain-containing putative transcriptional regulator [Actinocrinis sp.]|nr:BTAD domain-containing putative transcriptional regulator [Actinocrinis sp.]
MCPSVPTVRFLILGSLEVWSDRERLPLGGPRQERILAVLLLRANRMVPVARLVEAAWDDDPPNTAEHQIRKTIADLRKRLPGGPTLIETDSAGYRAVLSSDQLDLLDFRRLVREAREQTQAGDAATAVEHLQNALDLWRGQIFGGGGGPVIEGTAISLHEQKLTAAEQLIDLRLACGDSAELISVLRSLTQEHPLRESLRAQLMLALYRAGRQAESLEEYERIRRLLREQLGTSPDPKLVRRYEAILRNGPELALPETATPHTTPTPLPTSDPNSTSPSTPPAPPTPAPTNPPQISPTPSTLPYDLPAFVGRTEELAQLHAVAAQPPAEGARIVVIDAMGGAGKTALAVHAAHQVSTRFPDGRLYLDLHGFTVGHPPLTAGDALLALLRALGVDSDRIPDGLDERTDLWRTVTAERSLLLLLDNAADAAQIRPLLPAAPTCLVIVTSRNHLLELDGTVTVFLGALSEDSCRELVERIIGADRAAAEPKATANLIHLCGRLPLALRIAAARLRARPRWTVQHMVDRLQDEAHRLDELSIPDRSVAAVLRSSHQFLPEDRQAAFRLLSLHPGGDLDAYSAAALLCTSTDEADEVLESLLDAHLLEQYDQGRYVFHDLVRAFAHSLTGPDTAAADRTALTGLADYYLLSVENACDLLFPARMRVAWDSPAAFPEPEATEFRTTSAADAWFERELPNLGAVIRAAATAGLLTQAAHLPRGVVAYLHAHGHSRELLELGEIAVTAARALGDPVLLRVNLTNVTLGYWHFSRIQDALDCLHEALDLAEYLRDEYGQSVCLGHLAVFESHLGRYDESLEHIERAMSLLRSSGNPRQLINLLVTRSDALIALARFDEAAEAAQRAVAITEATGERKRTGLALINLAEAHIGAGDGIAALAALTRAGAVYGRQHRPLDALLVRARTAEAYLAAGQPDRARRIAEAIAANPEPWIPASREAAIGNALGRIFGATGRDEESLRWHRAAGAKAGQTGFGFELAQAQLGMARALAAAGLVDEAADHHTDAMELFKEMGVPTPL